LFDGRSRALSHTSRSQMLTFLWAAGKPNAHRATRVCPVLKTGRPFIAPVTYCHGQRNAARGDHHPRRRHQR
jgi:hypothetical protein